MRSKKSAKHLPIWRRQAPLADHAAMMTSLAVSLVSMCASHSFRQGGSTCSDACRGSKAQQSLFLALFLGSSVWRSDIAQIRTSTREPRGKVEKGGRTRRVSSQAA